MKRVSHITILNKESRRSFLKKFSAAVTVVFVSSCKDDPANTIVNLKAAITTEVNANAIYTAFSAKAKEEKYWKIANMFRAAAYAEEIHAKNHNEVLKNLGEPELKPTAETPTVKSTAENLLTAINLETKEYQEIYPDFISTAQKEKCDAAVVSFTRAADAEQNHAGEFSEALRVLKDLDSEAALPSVWFVCEQCGAIFKLPFQKCGICKADTERQHFVPKVFETEIH